MDTRWHSVCVCVWTVYVCVWGGYSETEKSQGGYSETEKSQSAKISDNFHWGGILKLKSHKVPRSLTIFLLGGGVF